MRGSRRDAQPRITQAPLRRDSLVTVKGRTGVWRVWGPGGREYGKLVYVQPRHSHTTGDIILVRVADTAPHKP